DYRRSATTVVIGYCTNACKRKLFAFVHIWGRYARGDEVTADDPIFEQFNAKCPKCGTVYADQQRKICEKCVKRSATMLRLLGYFKHFKLQFTTVMLCMFGTAAISLLTPIVSNQIFYDQVIAQPKFIDGVQIQGKLHETKWVYIMVAILFGMALLSLGIGILQNRANAYMSTRVTKNMKNDLFRALQHLSLSYFNQNSTGRLINRVNYDAVKIRSFYIDGVPHFIVNMLNFIGLTIFLFSINWKLTLIVYIPVPIIVFIFKYKLPKLWRMYSRQWRRSSSLNSMLGDSLNGVRVVKAFAKEAEETNRFYQYSEKLYAANLQTNLVHLTIFPVVSLLIGISSQAIWGFGGFQVMGEHMTYGQFATYLGYVGMIFGPLNFFTNFTNMLTDTINSAVRMFETLDMIPEITDAPNAVELDTIKGDIVFDQVNFHYNPNRPILKDVSFTIHAGDHVGLVGHTGSGKSTIANLITRMYDVISGSISIDGHNIKEIKVDSLRRNIAIVSQEIYLFYGTIADNIRYANPNASMEEVIAAARAANAHDFIMRLPEGYETMVGIGRRSLSGGERQRISIARALLMKPSLLILDEATAAMDTETERLISDAIEKLIKGRTTITIAHRLSTLKDCNYLMAIEHGEIAERGTAEELMEKKGVFYKLYTLQNEQMKKVMAGL
ncbi:MAG: ABC transporter ATP-binding protein, partial [Clostridia bacterium]|nr:ABC transporter ATP-binding protein [Clostridia bacterium]